MNKIISAYIKEREQTSHLDSSLYIHLDQDILLKIENCSIYIYSPGTEVVDTLSLNSKRIITSEIGTVSSNFIYKRK